MSNVQDNAAHTCSYSCDRPECIKAQRDELAAAAAQEAVGEMVCRASGITVPQMYGSQLPAGTKLYAAPVTAAPAGVTRDDAEQVIDRIMGEYGFSMPSRAYAELVDEFMCTTAAPGIDLATAWAEGYRSGVTDERISESNIGIAGFGAKIEPSRANPYMIDASHKGATLNEQFGSAEGFKAHIAEFIKLGRRHVTALYNSPRDEISMTDTGDWIQYAIQLLQLDKAKGGSEARDAERCRFIAADHSAAWESELEAALARAGKGDAS